jgi:phosphinothricin acetyltransferase
VRIRPAAASDAAAIADIYAHYVRETVITFDTDPPSTAEMAERIASGGDLYPWLVAEEDGALLGYAYAAAFRTRRAYRFAVETTVYLRPGSQGRGLGSALYRPLLETLATQGFTQAVAAITLPNEASVRLHERLGFTHAGTYRQVGWKLGQWLDVGLWQRRLASPQAPPPEPRPFDPPSASSSPSDRP